jgi:hypothetical protein
VAAFPSAGPDQSPQDLSAHWVWANVIAAAVAVVLGLLVFGVRQLLGMPDPDAGLGAAIVLFAAEIANAAIALAVYAVRTGEVLALKLPRFPMLTWIALHILIGVVLGIFVAISELGAAPTPAEVPERAMILGFAVGGVVAGAIVGALFGALQALVLRKVVREIGGWIQWSALAGTTLGAYALVLLLGSEPAFGTEVLTQLISFGTSLVSGVLMLPALHHLQPK